MESFEREDKIVDTENIQPTDDYDTCEVCAKSFSTKAFLKQHRLIYEHLEVFPCLVCQKTFSRASSLKTHKFVHTEVKPHQCTSCRKTFSQVGTLRKHQRIHTSEKLYNSTMCTKSFSTTGHLKRHKRIHTQEKPYQCGHVHTPRGQQCGLLPCAQWQLLPKANIETLMCLQAYSLVHTF